MKTLFTIFKIVFFLIFAGTGVVSAQAQDHFRIIGGIPHLPVVDPSTIAAPATGMLIYDDIAQRPMIYTGTVWETLCTSSVNGAGGGAYLNVLNKIPFLSYLNANPLGAVPPGAVYLSQATNSMMIHDNAGWNTVVASVGSGNFTADAGNFSTNNGLKISKLPVLSTNPNILGLTKGAIYINTVSKAIRYYDGATWRVVDCLPILTTIGLTSITNTSADSGANITNNGGTLVQKYGICWSKNLNPDFSLTTKIEFPMGGPTDLGNFPITFSFLEANTVYHVRAYAINSAGIGYGNDVSFLTAPAGEAIINTVAVSANTTFVSANSGGDIVSDGGALITKRGIIWSTTQDPKSDPSASISNDGSGFGDFPSLITNVIRNTTYNVRAYADNAAGRGYGDLKHYLSPQATTPVLNTSNLKITNITKDSADGEVIIINNGGDPVYERGIRYTTDHINYVHVPSATANPSDIGTFVSNLTGLTSGVTYYVQAYAKNAIGPSYGSESSFITTDFPTLTSIVPFNYDTASNKSGYLPGYNGTRATGGGDVSSNGVSMITKRGICWDKSSGPTDLLASKTVLNVNGSGVGTFYSDLTSLEPNTTYYVRAYATNGKGTGYSNEMTFLTPQQPLVTTATSVTVTNTTINGQGSIQTDGRVPLIERGLCWGQTVNPGVDGPHMKIGNGNGSFSGTIKNLRGGTPYHIRAYASNNLGVSYGVDVLVTTDPAEKPTITTGVIPDTSGSTTIGGGNITSDGGADVTQYGVIWSLTPNFTPDYTTAPNLTSQTAISLGGFSSTLSPLLPNRTYYVRAYAVNSQGPTYGDEKHFKTYTKPLITTTTASSLSATSAISGGNIIDDGGDSITKLGVVWDMFPNPTLEASLGKTESSGGLGSFVHTIDKLLGNTTYYVRAYAVNKAGVAYGGNDSFTTSVSVAPTVTTVNISKITGNTALGTGSIVSNGGSSILTCGILWSNVTGFTPSLSMTQRTSGTSEGIFTGNITGLTAGTPYFVRAYAKNVNGDVAYGAEIPFNTLVLANVTTVAPNFITSSSAVSGGTIVSNGGSFITENGICWSTSNTPTITDNHTVSGSGSGNFIANLTDLTAGTIYYVRAYAINAAGISYGLAEAVTTLAAVHATVATQNPSKIKGISASCGGNITSSGGANVDTRGIVWSINPAFVPETEMTNRTAEAGYGIGTFVHDMTPLSPGQTYHVYAYAHNSSGNAYGTMVSFTTPTKPSITTNPPGSVTATKAVMGGTITNSGGSDVLKRGVIWSTYTGFSPNINSPQKTEDGAGVGAFISEIKDLSPNATYYVVAYAINDVDISYGLEESVTMGAPSAPAVTTTAPTGITDTTANGGGNITDQGGLQVGTRGVVWNRNPLFIPAAELVNRTTQTGNGGGLFSSTITGLDPDTTYYIYAYAQNNVDISYGNMLSFKTAAEYDNSGVADISTDLLGPVNATTAFVGGTISSFHDSSKNPNVLNRGLVWDTTTGFTPNLNSVNKTDNGKGIGSFSTYIKALQPNTPYFVRAYAVTKGGFSFGDEQPFTTSAPTRPIVTTVLPSGIMAETATGGGEVIDEGGLNVFKRGLVWDTNPGFDPTIQVVNRTNNGTGDGIFSGTITPLSQNTSYYVRAYAENSLGATYGDVIEFTTPQLADITTDAPGLVTSTTAVVGGTITSANAPEMPSRGVLWSLVQHFTPNINSTDKIEMGTGIGTFNKEFKNLRANTTYYLRAYAVTKFGVSYGTEVDFTTTNPTAPIVTTAALMALSDTTAGGGGEITDDGGMAITAYGMVWSQNPVFDPSTEPNTTLQTGLGLGIFNDTMTGLNPGTPYYACAYASNGVLTGYGAIKSFTTLAKPTLTTDFAGSITGHTAVSGGQIASDGGTPITAQGVCWSQIPHPTELSLSRTNDLGTGSFTSSLTNLQPVRRYYYRAYATNNVGTSYGNEYFFDTPAVPPSITTTSPFIVMGTAFSGGTITSNGGSAVTASGIVWSNIDGFDPATSINKTTDGTSLGTFTSALNGLARSTSYYVRAYATNGVDTTYGTQLEVVISASTPILDTSEPTAVAGTTAISGGQITSDGGSDVTERGVCWSTAMYPEIPSIYKTSDPDLGGGLFTSTMSNLLPNQLYFVRAYAKNGQGVSYGLQKSFVTAAYPTLTGTSAATNIRSTTASSGGNITDDGRSPILRRGIVWDTYSNPTVALSTKTIDNTTTGIGPFSAGLSGLEPNTNYYVRAYATNDVGTTYGGEISFTTNVVSAPTVTTTAVTAVTNSAASADGLITDDGGMPILARGFVWDTNPGPTTILSTKIVTSGNGMGTFTDILPNLVPGQPYFVRAYATNNVDTGYGANVPFTMPVVVPVLSSVSVSNILMNSVDGSANLIFDGGAPITDMGLIWDTTNVAPALTATNHLSVGTLGTSISGTINGLLANTPYYVWAYAINSQGPGYSAVPVYVTTVSLPTLTTAIASVIRATTATSGGTITNNGGSPVTARGVCWDTATNPTVLLTTKTINGSGNGTFTSAITGLTKGLQYFVRAYATNGAGTEYGSNVPFTTLDSPSVTTDVTPTLVASTTATCGGAITNNGGSAVTSYGICWSLTANPTILDSKANTSGALTGPFTANLTSLAMATPYHYRAYATNGVDTSYGLDQIFTTLAGTPTLGTVVTSSVQMNNADGTATLISDGGVPIIEHGLVWNTVSTIPTAMTAFNSVSISPLVAVGSPFTGTMTGLSGNTPYYVWAYAKNLSGLVGYSATSKNFSTVNQATLTTTIISAITGNSATSGGTITNTGGLAVLDKGVCWSSTGIDPVVPSDSYSSNGPGYTSPFVTNLTGLTKGTPYKVRSYARNSMGYSYGNTISFTTLDTPSVTTNATPSVIGTTTATCGGAITSNGGSAILSYGICWSQTTNPTILNSKTTTNGAIAGAFTGSLTVLTPGVKYYFKAYATNTVGPAYGDEKEFTAAAVPPTVGNVTIAGMTDTTADGSATVTSDGGSALQERGLVYSSINSTPTISDTKLVDGSAGSGISATLTGLSEASIYYVRAYASNSAGPSYSPVVSFRICNPMQVFHLAATNGAPVDKPITYPLVSTAISGGVPKCWIAQNLGADSPAASVTDATEASAGWYWQFNRAQGYKHDGTTRTPNTTWISSINEAGDWLPANDPCKLQLGGTWRLPTYTEWFTADGAPQNWNKDSDVYNSVLKLHDAGSLIATTGGLQQRGAGGSGMYWSSNASTTTNGWYLNMSSSSSLMSGASKTLALPVRCLRDGFAASAPTVSNVTTPTMTDNSADGYATVTLDGGSPITERGLVWSSSTATPTISDNKMANGSTLGSFTTTILGLSQAAPYYVRAYATNSVNMTGYSPAVNSFRICPAFTATHVLGVNGAPTNKTITYGSVSSSISGLPKCWITRNLGADQQAGSVTDATEASAGWYWQFNRIQGYKHDGTNRTPNTAWTTSISESGNWSSTNDPCSQLLGGTWRLPTQTEWTVADAAPQNWTKDADAYQSVLKLHNAGSLIGTTGALSARGTSGMYWSNDAANTASGSNLWINSSTSNMSSSTKSSALPVRCLRDAADLKPSLTNVVTSGMTSNTTVGTALVISDGGSTVTDRGLVWNTTGNQPTSTDNVVSSGAGTGTFMATISGLSLGQSYYVWAYATNVAGTAYSPLVNSFVICVPFTAVHIAGYNGAPETKTITYNTVGSNATGSQKCWIAQNLGSSQQATSVADATEASAGWHWQFNRAQGYKHDGTTRTPGTAWITSISETNDWLLANDPCRLLLSGDWRLPTQTEWTVAASTNWANGIDAYNSVKLHAAGILDATSAWQSKGVSGYYASSSQASANSGYYMAVSSSSNGVSSLNKPYGLSVRCLRDTSTLFAPLVSNIVTSNKGTSSIDCSAAVTSDGGSAVWDRGLVWSNVNSTPTLGDNVVSLGSGLPIFAATLSGLSEGSTYYVRAYATNGVDTSYSTLTKSFSFCRNLTVIHTLGVNGAPVSKTVTYNTEGTSITGTPRCWITQNLGSSQQATSVNDGSEASAGWYWQFNRAQGYKHDGVTRTPATPWYSSYLENNDWLLVNDPCNLMLGTGWRVPTYTEWLAADAAPQNWGSATDAFNSVLKLHAAGYLDPTSAALTSRSVSGIYWSSTKNDAQYAGFLNIGSSNSNVGSFVTKAFGTTIRCLK